MIYKISSIIGVCLLAGAVQGAVFDAAAEKRLEKIMVQAQLQRSAYPHLYSVRGR